MLDFSYSREKIGEPYFLKAKGTVLPFTTHFKDRDVNLSLNSGF